MFQVVKLLTEHHFEFLCLKGGCTGWYESTLVKMPHCWKSHVAAHFTRIRILTYTWEKVKNVQNLNFIFSNLTPCNLPTNADNEVLIANLSENMSGKLTLSS